MVQHVLLSVLNQRIIFANVVVYSADVDVNADCVSAAVEIIVADAFVDSTCLVDIESIGATVVVTVADAIIASAGVADNGDSVGAAMVVIEPPA